MPIELTMPRLSDTMEQGTIIKWNVKEGDKVAAGDMVADIETDKATMEMQVFDDGTIDSIVVGEGQTVEVGTVIAVMAEADEEAGQETGAMAASADREPPPAAAEPPGGTAPAQPQEHAPAPMPASRDKADGDGRIKMSPVARRVADDHGIDAASIQGSGPGGRIVKRDVLRAMEAKTETAAAVAPSAQKAVVATPVSMDSPESRLIMESASGLEERRIELSNVRQTIARRLVESKTTIPHYQVTSAFNMDPLLGMRRTLNQQLESQHVKLSVNDFLVRACALAIHQHQEFNASWGEDHIQIHGEVNIGLAVALPPERGGGLLVATIRHADQKSLRALSADASRLAEKARTRGLSLEEMADSTFVISNLGMFGVEHFTAIINPPNSAILAVGAALEKPVVRDGELTVGHEMTATLSLDHRIIDGAAAARFLQTLRQLIENPATLLV